MNKIQINNLSQESFTELIAVKNHYYQMIESLKVTMLDGLKSFPSHELENKGDYENKIKVIEAAIDQKLSYYSRSYSGTPAN